MTKIDTNVAALKSLHHLQRNDENYSKAVERLSSGKRINNAGDDAAGASIVNRMTAQISGMQMAIRNAGDAISMSQVAEGAMVEVSDVLQRMRELGVQAANGSYSGADRVALNQEINQLKNELLRISETTSFNTTKLLNGTFQDTQFEIGFDETPQHTHTLTIKDVSPSSLGVWQIGSQLEKSATLSSVAASANHAVITAAADHDFAAGDIVIYEKGTSPIPGLIPGQAYQVESVPTTTTFTLEELDAGDITYGQLTAAGYGIGTGAKFHLATLAGAPNVSQTGGNAAGSNVLAAENLQIYGHVGTETATVNVGSTAREIATVVNDITSSTGVYATAETNARITFTPNDTTAGYKVVSFDLNGMNTAAIKVTASINLGTADGATNAELSDLRDKINGISGNTGISAQLSADKTYIDLFSPDGYDIVIDNFDFPQDTATALTTATINTSGANTNDTITSAAAHGFKVGDVVRLTSITGSENTLAGLSLDTDYIVKTVASSTTFTLATGSVAGTTVDITGTNAQPLTFTKALKTMNIQTMDEEKTLKGVPVELTDKELGSDETPNRVDNMRITGQVTFNSSNVFTIVPANDESIFRDAPQSASLTKISEMNVLTIRSAQRMLSAIDGSLLSVDAERGKLGATMNRMQYTIDNLSNIVMNTQVSKGRIADADMAEESVNLSKSQILQQAATAMLAQANQSMQSVLDLLR